jgi:DNA-binding NtrC family response regulator
MAASTAITSEIPLFLGSGPAITRIRRDIGRAAKSDAKVLITGESGVGKEIVARCIHAQSRRSGAGLITINCAGVPDTLLEAEFFGHVRGSFTGAYRDSPGVLSLSDRGTLFLDEVGEMSARMQALLLRFLDTGEIHRVGTTGVGKRMDVRIIAATNRHLPDRIAEGEFRADLYYRLNVIHLQIPPLRERREDIPALLESFLRTFAAQQRAPVPKCHPELLRQLINHEWSGNVRELRNVAERMVLLTEENTHDLEQLLPVQAPSVPEPAAPAVSRSAPTLPSAGVEMLFHRMVREGEGFWEVVHAPFLARDLTRAELRELIRQGLELTRGSYKQLVDLFNMPEHDYKRFLSFLRKYDCQLRFQDFRSNVVTHSAELERAG